MYEFGVPSNEITNVLVSLLHPTGNVQNNVTNEKSFPRHKADLRFLRGLIPSQTPAYTARLRTRG